MRVYVVYKEEQFYGVFDRAGLDKFLKILKKRYGQWSYQYTVEDDSKLSIKQTPAGPEIDYGNQKPKYAGRVRSYVYDSLEIRVLSFPLNREDSGTQMSEWPSISTIRKEKEKL